MTDTIFEYKEPSNPQTIGELVRALRLKAGMTQGELAQLARITVHDAALLEAETENITDILTDPLSPPCDPEYDWRDE